MRSLVAALAASACLLALAAPAAAEPGDIDGTWGFVGRVGLPAQAVAVAPGPDGSTLVATGVVGGSRLTKVDASGRTDDTFAPPITSIFLHDLALDGRGGWIGVGTARTADGERVAAERFLADGRPDPTYGSGGVAVSDVLAGSAYGAAVALRPDGSAYVVGMSETRLGSGCADNEADVLRFTSTGQLDASFASTGSIRLRLGKELGAWNLATSVVALPDGGAIVGFDYTHDVDADTACVVRRQATGGALIRYRADGTPEVAFGFNGLVVRGDRVTGLARTTDQQTIATDPGRVVRYDDRGRELASSPTNVGPSRPYVDGAGRVVVAGVGFPGRRVQRFTRGLAPDLAFGLCGTSTVGDGDAPGAVVASDGTITVASSNVLVRLQDETTALDGPLRNALGTWVTTSAGAMYTTGDALLCGSTAGKRLNRPVVGMAVLPSRNGYWLVASDGGIFGFGHARFFGSTGGIRLNKPIVGMAATPTGKGYWLVASDGGIFSFGDARFFGSTGAIRLNKPIVGMAASSTGRGYWLVASDGGIFPFGDAGFYGSAGGARVPAPIVGMAVASSGRGYWLAGRDGRIYGFGDAVLSTVLPVPPRGPVAGIAADTAGGGYWVTTTAGQVVGLPNYATGPPHAGVSTVVGIGGG
ncbi:MAG: Esterase [Actinomycetia bacterium]|nr:Esterase [Actinomycetes bacterium]